MGGRCKDCRWWEDPKDEHIWMRDDDRTAITTHRLCACPKIIDGSGRTFDVAPQLDQAVYCDSDDFRAVFLTGPEFGCINHERLPLDAL